MRAASKPNELQRGSTLPVAGLLCVLIAASAKSETFVETFDTDPIAAGRLVLFDGDGSRFAYDAVGKTLTASYDTIEPTTRLIHQLQEAYTDADDFEYEFDFEILSAGFFADPWQAAQLAWGLMNTQSTGPDRAGGDGGTPDAYDLCTVDYFPNLSILFASPSLGATIISSALPPAGYLDLVKFEFGHETQLSAEGTLPLDTLLTTRVVYDGRRRVATLTIEGPGGLLLINTQGGRGSANLPGGFDGDTTTIETEDYVVETDLHGLIPGDTFTVDAIGILLWNDSFAYASSVIADVRFGRIYFQGTKRTPAAIADFDADGDADGQDFITFSVCYGGSLMDTRFGCRRPDLDVDNDVDGQDFLTFATCYNGSLRPPRCP